MQQLEPSQADNGTTRHGKQFQIEPEQIERACPSEVDNVQFESVECFWRRKTRFDDDEVVSSAFVSLRMGSGKHTMGDAKLIRRTFFSSSCSVDDDDDDGCCCCRYCNDDDDDTSRTGRWRLSAAAVAAKKWNPEETSITTSMENCVHAGVRHPHREHSTIFILEIANSDLDQWNEFHSDRPLPRPAVPQRRPAEASFKSFLESFYTWDGSETFSRLEFRAIDRYDRLIDETDEPRNVPRPL